MLSTIEILLIYTFPEVGFISPQSDLNVVVFPAPFVPSKVKHSPFFMSKET